MNTRAISRSFSIGLGILLLSAGWAAAQNNPQPGECASGYCGTPKNNGGGGCGCGGGSILVDNTDIGKTYSKTDDYDGDGIADDFDNCPFIANRDQADQDGDKIGDACDNCAAAANPDQHDVNVNGIGDVCDPDIDGDKVPNAADNCRYVPNVLQTDTDKNGIGDVCDPDMDGDKVLNRVDNCPLVYNPDQAKSAPGHYGDACDNDTDKDAIEDAKDNCPAVYNPDQSDINANGVGDACDVDMDGDGVANTGGPHTDNCPTVPNPHQEDADHDGVGDACQTHGFCFVAGKNQAAKCLDPKTVFSVTAAPKVNARTGQTIYPAIYANRENTPMRFTWVISQQADGAGDSIRNATGTVSTSQAFEYHYESDDQRPQFVPTHPGTYKLTLAADLASPDPLFPGVVHALSEVDVQVDGPVVSSGGGCSLAAGAAWPVGDGALIAGALMGLGLVLRRRRRRG